MGQSTMALSIGLCLILTMVSSAVLKPVELSRTDLPMPLDPPPEKVRFGESEAALLLRLLKYYMSVGVPSKETASIPPNEADAAAIPENREETWTEVKRQPGSDGSRRGPYTPPLADRLLDRAWDHFIVEKGKLKRRTNGKLCYINPIACFGRRRETAAS
ncbi:hypothetical protein RvY_06266 [Ramazzottius varieornatus]|uniref:Uncharacterized protein n=1 Tax=Ramazzottius varieornatus TaxID=947166 RepID=A0A1D1V0Y0_RAMVA|nr:hypothetical protein RvY_06266 [Ramazzottius varieornatus]